MILRNWKFEDLLKISDLEKECFPEDAWSYRTLADVFGNNHFLNILVEEDGEIIGYGGMTVAYDTADMENIAVATMYRKSGIGTMILSNLLNQAKQAGVKRVFLEVRVSNASAMKLYLRNGFIGGYARLRYYKNGEDCLVMCKEIED